MLAIAAFGPVIARLSRAHRARPPDARPQYDAWTLGFFDEYLAGVDPPRRAALEHIRTLVKAAAPELEEGKSYAMPAFKYRGKGVVGFIAARNHLSLFPFSGQVVEDFRDRLDGFELSKGTIRFSLENPLPDDLVRDIVRRRIADIDQRASH
jgi:uncharacterized protein YdhG (YjbR/CyaY superfamily)